ncbi:6410_t:CDS:2 [Ambispora leptoticha]|uniref:6410_t:CDS:1 n=1 Tax=Ambispora leptoticha TaxID=144679 RepID=A0A9N8ZRB6_9GLOM|nr:6410_t:CDS:2 [Ambispora leptoticha]
MAQSQQYSVNLLDKGLIISEIHYVKQTNCQKPGFICTNGSKSSNVKSSPSTATCTLYQSMFGVKTEYSILLILGINNKDLIQKLTKDISFVSLFLKVDKHTIVISSIGYSSLKNYYGVGTGYISTIMTKISGQQ